MALMFASACMCMHDSIRLSAYACLYMHLAFVVTHGSRCRFIRYHMSMSTV